MFNYNVCTISWCLLTNHFVVCATEKECRFADCDVQQQSAARYPSYHHLMMNIIMPSPTPDWWNPEQCFLTRLSIGHYHSVRADLPFPSSHVRAHCCCHNSERCYKVFVVFVAVFMWRSSLVDQHGYHYLHPSLSETLYAYLAKD